jgi:hypothetical protein
MKLGELITDSSEDVFAHVATLVGDDARAKLYDYAGHRARE